ncbi:hypothetical protein FIBSPDRAFT_1045985 [Athelia psychrophila]|uniref:Uncharacterized protein n=1 Tax=Athelia psychrophila TaxID=1759441 RepID=A0A166HBC3_9AGAM|nr:hypothetical protein FIBSPDRAFT_1045985 [Fibularhizoctonia sp. CBS 109695]
MSESSIMNGGGPFNGDGGVQVASQPYTPSDARGVSLLIAASVLSLSAVVSLLGAIGLSAFNTRKSKDKNLFVRTHVAALFVSLLCCDALQAVGSIMSAKWINAKVAYIGHFCTAQGVIKQIADVGAAIFAFVIAMHTFWLLFLRWNISNRVLRITLILSWSALVGVVVSGPATFDGTSRGPFYGISGYWCWITDAYDPERLTLDYLFMFLSALFSFILYTLVFLRLRGNIVISGSYIGFRIKHKSSGWRRSDSADTQMMAVAKQMLLYPVAYTLIILPIAAARFSSFGGRQVPFAVTIFCDTVYQLSGVINVILFTTTRRVLPPNSITLPQICHRISLVSNSSKSTDEENEVYPGQPNSDFIEKASKQKAEAFVLDIGSGLDIPLENRPAGHSIKTQRSLEFSPISPSSTHGMAPPSPSYMPPSPSYMPPSPSYMPPSPSYITPPSPAYIPPYSQDNAYAFGSGLHQAAQAESLPPIAERDDFSRANSNEYRRSQLPEFFVPFDYSGENSEEHLAR